MFFPLFLAASQAQDSQVGGLKEISRWLTERDSAEMASPQAMARRACHDRVPALAGGHDHNNHNDTVATSPVNFWQASGLPRRYRSKERGILAK
jgi:hypothetical protein